MTPRPRKHKKSPLPPYVYLQKGRYIYKPYLGSAKGKPRFGKEVRLCGADASIAEVWKCYENHINKNERQTLSWMLGLYLQSDKLKSLKPRTQESYEMYARQLIEHQLKHGGTFGNVLLIDINQKVVRRYLDAAEHKVAANRRVQFLKAVYSWAIQRLDGVESNPCAGVELNKEESRTRYVEDWEYEVVFMCAVESGSYAYIALMMEIAYLCRQRRNEVSARTVNEIVEQGLITYRGKRSRGEITQWSPRLRAIVEMCLEYNKDAPTPINAQDKPLIRNKRGKPITKNAFDTAWQRVRDRAMNTGWNGKKLIVPFTYHDIKAKGITDHEKQDGGHMTEKARQIYIRKLKEQVSTR